MMIWGEARLPGDPVTKAMIDAERDRRLAVGFIFQDHRYQARELDRNNMTGKAVRAGRAIAAGAESGNLRWSDPDNDFGWIDAHNEIVAMDAFELLDLAEAMDDFVTKMMFIGRSLKDGIEAGMQFDITADSTWGQG